LEARIGVPVVQAVAARCWEIQLRLGVGRPLAGYGKLLAEMPPG
jgi:maleate cis-trans isomerase